MPNWCTTSYAVDGPEEQLQRLYDLLTELQEMPAPGLVRNDFGSSWLGNLVTALGESPQKIGRCRGYYYDPVFDGNTLRFFTETAWCEADDTRHLIEKKFPGVKLYYVSEEFGCCYWVSNDINHTHFNQEYYICSCDWSEDPYLSTLDELVEAVEEITGASNLKTFEDCEQALEGYDDSDGCAISIMALEFQDD